MQSICYKCGNSVKSGKTVFVFEESIRTLVTVCRECKIKYYGATK